MITKQEVKQRISHIPDYNIKQANRDYTGWYHFYQNPEDKKYLTLVNAINFLFQYKSKSFVWLTSACSLNRDNIYYSMPIGSGIGNDGRKAIEKTDMVKTLDENLDDVLDEIFYKKERIAITLFDFLIETDEMFTRLLSNHEEACNYLKDEEGLLPFEIVLLSQFYLIDQCRREDKLKDYQTLPESSTYTLFKPEGSVTLSEILTLKTTGALEALETFPDTRIEIKKLCIKQDLLNIGEGIISKQEHRPPIYSKLIVKTKKDMKEEKINKALSKLKNGYGGFLVMAEPKPLLFDTENIKKFLYPTIKETTLYYVEAESELAEWVTIKSAYLAPKSLDPEKFRTLIIDYLNQLINEFPNIRNQIYPCNFYAEKFTDVAEQDYFYFSKDTYSSLAEQLKGINDETKPLVLRFQIISQGGRIASYCNKLIQEKKEQLTS